MDGTTVATAVYGVNLFDWLTPSSPLSCVHTSRCYTPGVTSSMTSCTVVDVAVINWLICLQRLQFYLMYIMLLCVCVWTLNRTLPVWLLHGTQKYFLWW